MGKVTYPENFKVVILEPPTTTNGALTSDCISLKNANMVWVEFVFKQAASHETVCYLYESTAVGSSGNVITETMPIWKNADIDTTDTLVRGTDAATVTLTAGATDQHVVMQFDPAKFTSGYDCLYAYTSASSQGTNYATIHAVIDTKYKSDVPPAAITD